VRAAPEVRPGNATYNNTRGTQGHPESPRITGNYTGTTDEILQWAACKWGLDEDIVRAQIAVESWWEQTAVGDTGTSCHSFGLGQVRRCYHDAAFEDAVRSSAYNVDYTYYRWRSCYEGNDTWLGGSYGPGDVWGCLGLWFSGRWHTPEAEQYIAKVQDYLNQRVWEDF
jgi:autotransporter family porin